MTICDSFTSLIARPRSELPHETYATVPQTFTMVGNDFGMWDNHVPVTWEGEPSESSGLNLDAQVVDQYVLILKSFLTLLIYGSHGWDQYSNLPIASTSTGYGLGNYYGNMTNASTSSNNVPYIPENPVPHSGGQMAMLHNVSESGMGPESYYAIDPATEDLFDSFLAKTGGLDMYENQSYY